MVLYVVRPSYRAVFRGGAMGGCEGERTHDT